MPAADINFIPQEYSRGRLCLTSVAFYYVLDCMKAFPYFLALGTAYGVKTHEGERIFSGLRSCQRYSLDVVERQVLRDSFQIRCGIIWIQSFATMIFM